MSPELTKLLENFNLDNYKKCSHFKGSDWHNEILKRAFLTAFAKNGDLGTRQIEKLLKIPLESNNATEVLTEKSSEKMTVLKLLFTEKYFQAHYPIVKDLSCQRLHREYCIFRDRIAEQYPEKFKQLIETDNNGLSYELIDRAIRLIKSGDSDIDDDFKSLVDVHLPAFFDGDDSLFLLSKLGVSYPKTAMVSIDLGKSKEDIKNSFNKWLEDKFKLQREIAAKRYNLSEDDFYVSKQLMKNIPQNKISELIPFTKIQTKPTKGFSRKDFDKWVEYRILPFMDLEIAALSLNEKMTNLAITKYKNPTDDEQYGDKELTRTITDTIKPLCDELKTPMALRLLAGSTDL